MPPKVQKSKAAKALAAMSGSKAKGKKKKWSKGKMREKKNHRVMFNKAILEKIMTDVPKKMKVITVYSMIENFKINGSLARRVMKDLASKGLIVPVSNSSKMPIYTKKAAPVVEETADETAE